MYIYPHIILSIAVKSYLENKYFDLFINPFEVKFAPHQFDPQMIEDDKLTKKFIEFMMIRFPYSDYMQKITKYFEAEKIFKRVDENCLFSK